MSAHVPLLLDQLLQGKFHREVPVIFGVYHEHGLDEHDRISLVDVVVLFGSLAGGAGVYLGRQAVFVGLAAAHVDTNFDWRVILAGVVELEIDF